VVVLELLVSKKQKKDSIIIKDTKSQNRK